MNILRLALCDVRRMFKDKMAIFWMLAMPLGFVYMFSMMMGGPRKETTWLGVLNQDEHELAQLFVEELKTDGYNIDLRTPEDEVHFPQWNAGRVLIIPATFSQDLLKGERVFLTFLEGKNANSEKTTSAQTRLLRTLVNYTGALATVDVVKNRWTQLNREKFLQELHKPQRLKVEVKEHPSLRPPPYGVSLTLPSYLIMFVLMISIMYGGVTLAEEREKKQLVRIIAAPLHSHEIFLGKMLARMMQPALQSVLILGCGYLLFGVYLGDHPLAYIPVLVCFSFFCGSIGMLFGSLCKNEKQISTLGILTTMILSALGGCWWPIEFVPDVFKTVALFTPTYWGLQGLHDVMSFGKSFAGVIPECLLLLLFGSMILAVAVPIFEWQKRQG